MFFKPLAAKDVPARSEAAKRLRGACLLATVSGAALAVAPIPPSKKAALGQAEPFCNSGEPQEWREAGTLEGVSYQESRVCDLDNPADIAAFVKGTNNLSMEPMIVTNLAPDAITMSDDMDGDGDPDRIVIKLEIMEINGHSPDAPENVTAFDIAPGIQPSFWVFVPKMRDMSTKGYRSPEANALLCFIMAIFKLAFPERTKANYCPAQTHHLTWTKT